MNHFASSNLSCLGNQHCLQLAQQKVMSNVTETASITLGVTSVIAWFIAEIPQIITNYKEKSTEGLSVAFLVTWLIGDLFNIFGCLLEPATLYAIITVSLCSQAIYYGHIYPRLKLNRQIKDETPPNAERNKSGMEKANDADQSNGFDDFNTGIRFSSPIPVLAQKVSPGRELYYQSARYLSKSHSPKAGFIFDQSVAPTSYTLIPEEEPLLDSAIATQSSPVLNIKTTLCLVSTLTFLGAFNLLQSPDRRIHSMVPKPRQEFVIYIGRKLLQVGGNLSPELGEERYSVIGPYLGWAMAFIYIGGRLPQICLNGVNPLMFVFALVGNGTYVASILVRSLNWSIIRPNLPWLVDAGGCFLLDSFLGQTCEHEAEMDSGDSQMKTAYKLLKVFSKQLEIMKKRVNKLMANK
ncbi:hypothetical protein RIF29_19622 [Crotalaria pallida]|uniref:Uncharacterized protein n=1 Tax=Crotalaria pallida TaxID=3830 RepID=A0AAN9F235_CROPI